MKLYEEFKLFEEMWEEASTEETTKLVEAADNFDSFDFGGYEAGTTTYDITIDGSSKKAGGTYPGPEALRNILRFINGLTQEEKDSLGLSWQWDSEEPGDCCGDTIVYIVAPSEDIDHWGGRSGSNLPEAEVPIRKALGISLKEPNILMEPDDKRGALKYAVRFKDDQASVFYIGYREDCQHVAEVTATSDFAKKHGGVTVERYYG